MQISPDLIVLWRLGFLELNGTILFTWVVMGVLVLGSWSVTRRLSTDVRISRWQNLLESVVSNLQQQLKEATRRAHNFTRRTIASGYPCGKGAGVTNPSPATVKAKT